MTDLARVRTDVDRLRGRLEELRAQAKRHERERDEALENERTMDEALVVVRAVALETQRQLEFHLSSLATLALSEVFGEDAYRLSVKFVERRGRTECDVAFRRGRRGEAVHPMSAAGGGAVDVAAFALRLSLWTMKKSAPVMILDEPFRFLSTDLRPRAAKLVKELSERLGIQFVIVTHDETLAGAADKTFKVTKKGKESNVEEI